MESNDPDLAFPTPEPRFALAGPNDEESVLQLMREFYPGEHLTYREDVARAGLGALWRDPTLGRVFLIHAGDELAGYCVLAYGFSFEFHGRDALIDELYVRARYRGHGYGSAFAPSTWRWTTTISRRSASTTAWAIGTTTAI